MNILGHGLLVITSQWPGRLAEPAEVRRDYRVRFRYFDH